MGKQKVMEISVSFSWWENGFFWRFQGLRTQIY